MRHSHCSHLHYWDINGWIYCQQCGKRLYQPQGRLIILGVLLAVILLVTGWEIYLSWAV